MADAKAAPLFARAVDPVATWTRLECLYPLVAQGPSIRDEQGRVLLQVVLERTGFATDDLPYEWSVRLLRWRYGRGTFCLPSTGPYRFTAREWAHPDEASAREHAARLGAAIERKAAEARR